MFLNHCIQLLETGGSDIRPEQLTDLNNVVFRLSSGVRVHKLDSIKTALLMIEAIKLSWAGTEYSVDPDNESMQMFDNFVSYTYEHFSSPVAMALVKYAFKDRKLIVRKASKSSQWARISELFKPTLLDNSQAPGDLRLKSQFERCYSRLKGCSSISNCLNTFIQSELNRMNIQSVMGIDRSQLA